MLLACLSPESRLLSAHTRSRDDNGIPLIYNTLHFLSLKQRTAGLTERDVQMWNQDHRRLYRAVAALDDYRFLVTKLRQHLRLLPGLDAVSRARGFDMTVEAKLDHLAMLSTWTEQILRVLRVLLDLQVAGVPDMFPRTSVNPFKPELTLMRIWHNESHTLYTDDLGFRCSDWRRVRPLHSYETLTSNKAWLEGSLRTHTELTDASSWISLTNSVNWVLRHAKRWRARDSDSDCRVAVLSVAKMDRLGVLWDRSDRLVHAAGAERWQQYGPGENGVKYAWPDHFMAYAWIPAQCVLMVSSFDEFEHRCRDRGITGETDVVRVT